ncbi:MAG: M28 family peptidase [Bacteroidales bacterium]|nr:M28 family peptidase [Bacteroidales bacterium]
MLFLFLVSFAGKFVLIPLTETNDLVTLFNNKELKIHHYCDDYVLATTENLTYTGTLVLDDFAFENNRPYAIVYFYDTYVEDYLSGATNSAKTLYFGKDFLIMKYLSDGFVPAKKDAMIMVRNIEAKLPKFRNDYPEITEMDPNVQSLIEKVNIGSLMDKIQHLQDYGARAYFKPQAYETQEWIKSKFEAMGLDVELQYFSTAGNWMGTPDTSSANVIAIQRGTKYPNEYIVCGAHYDSYARWNWDNCPGADDNASGTSGILEIARILSQYKFERSIIYCCFSAEEIGLYGSDAYATHCREQSINIVGYFNMDMIGYVEPGASVKIHFSTPDTINALANYCKNVCDIYFSEMPFTHNNYISASDHRSFINNGYFGITSIEFAFVKNFSYHTPSDTIGFGVNSTEQVEVFVKANLSCIAILAKYIMPNNIVESNKRVSIYPNPANDKLFIEGEFISQNIEIIDMNGKLVASKTTDSNIVGIEITHLTQGVYFVKISNIVVGKFVKKL